MFINFDQDDLTNLFKSEPIYIFEKESGMFMYSFSDDQKTEIIINVSIYENELILMICRKEGTPQEIKLKNVEDLILENGCLRIHQNDAEQDIIIQFTPDVSVNYTDNHDRKLNEAARKQ